MINTIDWWLYLAANYLFLTTISMDWIKNIFKNSKTIKGIGIALLVAILGGVLQQVVTTWQQQKQFKKVMKKLGNLEVLNQSLELSIDSMKLENKVIKIENEAIFRGIDALFLGQQQLSEKDQKKVKGYKEELMQRRQKMEELRKKAKQFSL